MATLVTKALMPVIINEGNKLAKQAGEKLEEAKKQAEEKLNEQENIIKLAEDLIDKECDCIII